MTTTETIFAECSVAPIPATAPSATRAGSEALFGNPETTPGGKALKFYASVRIDIRRKDTLKDAAGNAVGNHVKVKIVKNKVAPPFAEAEFDIIYNHGINKEGSILDVGLESGAV